MEYMKLGLHAQDVCMEEKIKNQEGIIVKE